MLPQRQSLIAALALIAALGSYLARSSVLFSGLVFGGLGALRAAALEDKAPQRVGAA